MKGDSQCSHSNSGGGTSSARKGSKETSTSHPGSGKARSSTSSGSKRPKKPGPRLEVTHPSQPDDAFNDTVPQDSPPGLETHAQHVQRRPEPVINDEHRLCAGIPETVVVGRPDQVLMELSHRRQADGGGGQDQPDAGSLH